ncbi:hypothetical protein [Rhizomonospora bruguierae]|uniref:hypothetical protein n=1 Tax=Rhizomonospora bruguierae TaxID=1581705 RepID=UPI001BCDA83D|nr:hypothetical protein [Micromonospora sp. NBRC 107566]
MLLLAGTSEAGKSTAGDHLAARGACRVKIRTILAQLASGIPAEHEGVTVREGFDQQEFIQRVLDLPIPDGHAAVVIESFIDATLAGAIRRAWPARCRIVFVTADRDRRLHRLAAGRNLTPNEAAALIDAKDTRKHVRQQLERWRLIADDWIDNDGTRDAYLARLDQIFADLTTHDRNEGAA